MLLFLEGDSIPGFSAMQRQLGQEWVAQNNALLQLSENSFDGLYTSILASLIDEGAREVATALDRHHADEIIDAVIEYLKRVMIDNR